MEKGKYKDLEAITSPTVTTMMELKSSNVQRTNMVLLTTLFIETRRTFYGRFRIISLYSASVITSGQELRQLIWRPRGLSYVGNGYRLG